MDLTELLQQLDLESDAIAILMIALALFIILFLNRKRFQLRYREWRMQRSLKRIGCEQIRNLSCADGLDGYYEIDRLALTRDAILLISYKPYGGNIYCAERISEWTQVIEQKSFKFENPLFELDNQITAMRLIIGKVPLQGYLFFDQSALFPKGHPDAVLNPDNIPERLLAENCDPVNPEIRRAWEILKTQQNDASAAGRIGVKT